MKLWTTFYIDENYFDFDKTSYSNSDFPNDKTKNNISQASDKDKDEHELFDIKTIDIKIINDIYFNFSHYSHRSTTDFSFDSLNPVPLHESYEENAKYQIISNIIDNIIEESFSKIQLSLMQNSLNKNNYSNFEQNNKEKVNDEGRKKSLLTSLLNQENQSKYKINDPIDLNKTKIEIYALNIRFYFKILLPRFCTVKIALKLIVEKLNYLVSNLSMIERNPDNYDLVLPIEKDYSIENQKLKYIPLFEESQISDYKSNKYTLIKKQISLEQGILNSKLESLINLSKKKNKKFIYVTIRSSVLEQSESAICIISPMTSLLSEIFIQVAKKIGIEMKESNYIFVEDNMDNRNFPFFDSLSFLNFFYGKIINYNTPISEIKIYFLLLIQKRFGDYITPNRKLIKDQLVERKGTLLNSCSDSSVMEKTSSNLQDFLSWGYVEFTAHVVQESKNKLEYIFGIDKSNIYFLRKKKSEMTTNSQEFYHLNIMNSENIQKIMISRIKKVEKSRLTNRIFLYYSCKFGIEYRLIIEFESEEQMNNCYSKISFIRSD